MGDPIGIINAFSGVIQIAMSIFVFLSDSRNKVKRYYSLSALFLGLWSLSIFFYTNPIIFGTTIWLKIVYTMAYCMTLGLILFAMVYPRELKSKFRIFFIINFVYMFVIGIVLWKTDLIVISTQNIPSAFNSIALMGPLYAFYGFPELITALYVVGYYIKQVSVLSGIEKRQVQFYVIGGVIMLIPVFLFDFGFPLIFNNTEFYKYGTVGNVLWTMIVGYSILTTRFLDMRVVLGSLISTFVKSFFILISFILILFVVQPIWNISLSLDGFIKLFSISILTTFLLIKIFKKVENFLTNHFVYTKYNPVKSLRLFINKNSKILDFNVIVRNLLDLIYSSFKPTFISIIIFDSKGNLITKEEEGDIKSGYTKDISEILDAWRKLNSNRILIFSELKYDKRAGKRIIDQKRNTILSFMKKNSVEIIFALREEEKFDGMVMIGQNYDRGSYTVSDIDFLDNVMQNCHMALVRAMLYLELQSFNKTLQSKVDNQTQELQVKVLELQEARKKERDMIDIMGHELRTPATIIKLNAELLEKYVNSNPDEYKKYLGRIRGSIENEIKLINTLLTSAKLEGNRIEINKEVVDIAEEIEMVLHGYEGMAKEKGLKIFSDIPSNVSMIYADKVRTIEILDNLVGNGLKYTKEGSVTVKVENDGEFVKISVVDTGGGIPSKEIPMLGSKFHRVGNYTGGEDDVDIVRPGGTGLGLFVAFGLVNLMGGKIFVESELGKGSKFIFTLPSYKGQKINNSSIGGDNDMFSRLGLKR